MGERKEKRKEEDKRREREREREREGQIFTFDLSSESRGAATVISPVIPFTEKRPSSFPPTMLYKNGFPVEKLLMKMAAIINFPLRKYYNRGFLN